MDIFDNTYIKEYFQGRLVGVYFPEYQDYDGLLYACTNSEYPASTIYIGEYSIEDIILMTGMVVSKAQLKRLIKQNGISVKWKFGEKYPYPLSDKLLCQEGYYEVWKGQRYLEIVVSGRIETFKDCEYE